MSAPAVILVDGTTQSQFSLSNGRKVAIDVRNHGALRLAMMLDVAFEGVPSRAFAIDGRGFLVVSDVRLIEALADPDTEPQPLNTSTSDQVAKQALRYLGGLDGGDWARLGGNRHRETDLQVEDGWWRLILSEEVLPAVAVRITPA